jgi:hypothetical protein
VEEWCLHNSTLPSILVGSLRSGTGRTPNVSSRNVLCLECVVVLDERDLSIIHDDILQERRMHAIDDGSGHLDGA